MKIESIFFLMVLMTQFSCNSQTAPPKVAGTETTTSNIRVLEPHMVVCGAERFDQYLNLLEGKKVGVVVNQTSMVGDRHLVDALIDSGIHVMTVFAPEHGFRGDADAGAHIDDGIDVSTGLPILSLHGANKKPKAEQLQPLDVVVFDIQDVGARFYTYLSTLKLVMEACAQHQTEMIILDRPNPNGFYVDGPVLEPPFESFVGALPVPIVHGMTLGEMAGMMVGEGWIEANELEFTVIPCLGYDHNATYILPVKPSPNLPNHQSVLLYPSLCLFEPTAYSIGRGTDAQFQVLGRPESGFGSFYFTPKPTPGAMQPKLEGELCRGDDLRTYPFDSIYRAQQLDLGRLLKRLSGDQSSLVTSRDFFNKLAGTDQLYDQLKNKVPEAAIRASWEPALGNYKLRRLNYLLYKE